MGHRLGHGCRQILGAHFLPLLLGIVDQVDRRRLQTGKGKIIGMILDDGQRQRVFCGIALFAQPIQRRAAGIRQTQHATDFVKGFAGCIIPGSAHHFHMGVVDHIQNDGMSARSHQRRHGRLQFGEGDVIGCHMAANMMHRHEGLVQRQRSGLGKVGTHQKCSDQTGSTGGCHRINIGQLDSRLLDGLFRHQRDLFHVLAAGDFGHHTAVKGMHIGLRIDHIGEDFPPVPGDGAGRLITGTFHC